MNTPEPSTLLGDGGQELGVETEATGGIRLDNTRAADREWRGELALHLHRRLEKLRRSDKLIQRWAAGISGLMLLSAPVMSGWDRIHDPLLVLWLIVGAAATSLGSLGAIVLIEWCQERTRRWIYELGLLEELGPSERASQRKGDTGGGGGCTACWVSNPAGQACAKCHRELPAEIEGNSVRKRLRQVGVLIGVMVGIVGVLIGCMLLFGWFILGLAALAGVR